MAWRSLLPVWGTVHTSPPSGAIRVSPALGTGISATAQLISDWSKVMVCHGPLMTMAALPEVNCSPTSPCPQFRTPEEADPSLTRSTHSWRAPAADDEAMSVSSAPLDQKKGRNCQEPS